MKAPPSLLRKIATAPAPEKFRHIELPGYHYGRTQALREQRAILDAAGFPSPIEISSASRSGKSLSAIEHFTAPARLNPPDYTKEAWRMRTIEQIVRELSVRFRRFSKP
jgi:hypothetical protein